MFQDTANRWEGINMLCIELKAININVKSNKVTGTEDIPSELIISGSG